MPNYDIFPLTKEKFTEAVELVLAAKLDTREQIEHHLSDLESHYVAVDNNQSVIGVVGWYQDIGNYAAAAMGDTFPGKDSYWVGFFAVDQRHRGQGVGYQLLQKLETAVRKKGVSQLWVASVVETVEYYQRQGFSQVTTGEIDDVSYVFMVKEW